MTTIKTTFNVDEERWERFKEAADFLSDGKGTVGELLEEAMDSFDVVGMLDRLAKEMGWERKGYPSLKEVEESRPKAEGSSTDIVREMRGDRENRLSGYCGSG
jgi:hypothetical protein